MQKSLADLKLLTEQAGMEQEESDAAVIAAPRCQLPGVFRAQKSSGGEARLLKTMLSSACERNCNYCAFRSGRNFHRATVTPDDLAKLFFQMHSAGLLDGLFLSSGMIGGGIKTQDKIIAAAEILRKKFHYSGYIHLKLMPGSEFEQVRRTMQLANRVSINLEGPNAERLAQLAPKKQFDYELMTGIKMAHHVIASADPRSSGRFAWPSLATQLVVGPAGENDVELLSTSARLFQQYGLRRVYYSRFNPVIDTPLENAAPESPTRQLRLYQASFLLRDYHFQMEDFLYLPNGNLPLDKDPKTAWAEHNLAERPLEINTADEVQLLQVPGIGPKGARSILNARGKNPIKNTGDLRRLGINPDRALPYIQMNGNRAPRQLRLW
jgi:predicted DNA-binding helix-hairpin-helix protein